MLDWKRIDKHPPPKRENHDIALINAELIGTGMGLPDAKICRFDPEPYFKGQVWLCGDGPYATSDFTHWAEIGPLPTMETDASETTQGTANSPPPETNASSDRYFATRAAERMRERAAEAAASIKHRIMTGDWKYNECNAIDCAVLAIRALPTDGE